MDKIKAMRDWLGKMNDDRTIENYSIADGTIDITTIDAMGSGPDRATISERVDIYEYLIKVKIIHQYVLEHFDFDRHSDWYINFGREVTLTDNGVEHIDRGISVLRNNLVDVNVSNNVLDINKRLNREFETLFNHKDKPNWKFNKLIILPLLPLLFLVGIIVKKKLT